TSLCVSRDLGSLEFCKSGIRADEVVYRLFRFSGTAFKYLCNLARSCSEQPSIDKSFSSITRVGIISELSLMNRVVVGFFFLCTSNKSIYKLLIVDVMCEDSQLEAIGISSYKTVALPCPPETSHLVVEVVD